SVAVLVDGGGEVSVVTRGNGSAAGVCIAAGSGADQEIGVRGPVVHEDIGRCVRDAAGAAARFLSRYQFAAGADVGEIMPVRADDRIFAHAVGSQLGAAGGMADERRLAAAAVIEVNVFLGYDTGAAVALDDRCQRVHRLAGREVGGVVRVNDIAAVLADGCRP